MAKSCEVVADPLGHHNNQILWVPVTSLLIGQSSGGVYLCHSNVLGPL